MQYRMALGCLITFFCCSLSAQIPRGADYDEVSRRTENYQELKRLGYADKEIFEDLGNANFLLEKYDTAVFWYEKLLTANENGTLRKGLQKRYDHAQQMTDGAMASNTSNTDWEKQVQADYKVRKKTSDPRFKAFDFKQNRGMAMGNDLEVTHAMSSLNGVKFEDGNEYKSPIAMTADGKTAYFSKAIYVKPVYGLFSKKQLVHRIYRAEKVNEEWTNVKEIALCPKNFSAMHPTVSDDGKRLFFTSDMPGTFGKYDIYVSTIRKDGTAGIAKNLGAKVNTKKNDMHPNIVGDGTLVFASEGRKGYGGLDLYMTQVGQRHVGVAVNLGSHINSKKDDYSIFLMSEEGKGYVMSNRGKNRADIHPVAFSYDPKKKKAPIKKDEYNFLAAFGNGLKVDYTSSVFEDE